MTNTGPWNWILGEKHLIWRLDVIDSSSKTHNLRPPNRRKTFLHENITKKLFYLLFKKWFAFCPLQNNSIVFFFNQINLNIVHYLPLLEFATVHFKTYPKIPNLIWSSYRLLFANLIFFHIDHIHTKTVNFWWFSGIFYQNYKKNYIKTILKISIGKKSRWVG